MRGEQHGALRHDTVMFVDAASEVAHAGGLARDGGSVCVALTADAATAFERQNIPHVLVAAFADLAALARMDREINTTTQQAARQLEQFLASQAPEYRVDGPGLLSGQGYLLQYSASAILTRALLMMQTVRRSGARRAVVLDSPIDQWFVGDGYVRNPWVDVFARAAIQEGVDVEIVPPSGDAVPRSPSASRLSRARAFPGRLVRYAARTVRKLSATPVEASLARVRVLLVDARTFDWRFVVEAAARSGAKGWHSLDSDDIDGRLFTRVYPPVLDRHTASPISLNVAPFCDEWAVDPGLSALTDEWRRGAGAEATLDLLGFDLMPALMPQLARLAHVGPSIARYVDAVTEAAFTTARPDVVAFSSIPSLAAQRIAFAARKRGIPVVCYQHGGVYGTHVRTAHQQLEFGHADYMLTYGDGIRLPADPALPVRATMIPVGSARIESMIRRSRPRPTRSGRIRILWIAECSTRNTVGGDFQMEDTARYLLERDGCACLAASPRLEITFRPYPEQTGWSGSDDAIRRMRLPVRVDISTPMSTLIRRADIAITNCTGGTVWAETLGLGLPLIAFCNPEQTPLEPAFSVDLDRACLWCRTLPSMMSLLERLARDPEGVLAEANGRDRNGFARRYVLHDGRGAVSRVAAALASLAPRGATGRAVWAGQNASRG